MTAAHGYVKCGIFFFLIYDVQAPGTVRGRHANKGRCVQSAMLPLCSIIMRKLVVIATAVRIRPPPGGAAELLRAVTQATWRESGSLRAITMNPV